MIRAWTAVVIGLGLASALCIGFLAPPDAQQGYVQKIFYIHVSSAMAMYLGFGVGALGALWYVLKRAPAADALAVAGIEVGVVFCSIVLVTGPIWARPIWGVWWTWDARLTSTLFAWLIFVSYLLIRGAIADAHRRRIVSAAVALIGICDLPIIVFAVRLWRGAHPSVLGNDDSMPATMRITLILTMITLLALAGLLIVIRRRAEARSAAEAA